MRFRHFAWAGAVAALTTLSANAGNAAPAAPSAPSVSGAHTDLTTIQYRGDGWRDGRRYHNRRNDGWGRGVGPFLGGLAAGAIIGGAASGGYASGTSGTNDAYARCSAQFRSFDPQSGTYTAYTGEQRVCPYLR
jgi:hypothetical protein